MRLAVIAWCMNSVEWNCAHHNDACPLTAYCYPSLLFFSPMSSFDRLPSPSAIFIPNTINSAFSLLYFKSSHGANTGYPTMAAAPFVSFSPDYDSVLLAFSFHGFSFFSFLEATLALNPQTFFYTDYEGPNQGFNG